MHTRLPVLEQAKIEFGFSPMANQEVMAQEDVNYDNLLERVRMVAETRKRLIAAQIEYYQLLLEYKQALQDLITNCQKPVDPLLQEYYMNLISGLSLKLESMQSHSRKEFALEGADLNGIKERLARACEENSVHLNKILSRRTEYERLARQYGELKRAVRAKNI